MRRNKRARETAMEAWAYFYLYVSRFLPLARFYFFSKMYYPKVRRLSEIEVDRDNDEGDGDDVPRVSEAKSSSYVFVPSPNGDSQFHDLVAI